MDALRRGPAGRPAVAALVASGAVLAGLPLVHARLRRGSRWWRTNYAGREVSLAAGPVSVGAALLGLAVLDQTTARSAALAVAGAGLAGAVDDLYGSGAARGFRGHLAALRRGTVTTGAVKIVGVGLSGLGAALLLPRSDGRRWEVMGDAVLVAAAANLINLFDLRPGRAAKVVTVASIPLLPASAPLLGAALGALPADLRERSMFGDCGANALGAGLGVVAAARLAPPVRWLLLLGIAGLTLASERVSFSAVIARHPGLRRLDEWGRRAGVAGSPSSTVPPVP